MIVKNSEILYKELTKSRISIDILLEKLRKKSRWYEKSNTSDLGA